MKSSEARLQRDGGLLRLGVVRQRLGLLLLLEAAEVVLDEESGVEFTHGHLVLD